MNERERILARVREALRTPAPRPALRHHDPGQIARPGPASKASPMGHSPRYRLVLPSGAEDPEERLALFRKNAASLKADFHLLSGRQEMIELLRRLRDGENWRQIGSHQGELTDLACGALSLPVCATDAPYDRRALEACDAGISECDALVAQTGSVLLTARSAGGRALSVLPPHHVVLARRDQLVSDLPEAFVLLKARYGAGYPSFISFITGPSRTGDIERILVLGAHGPKKLTILCI